eukprot:9442082-Heterocapsa_arctica.AAC.1
MSPGLHKSVTMISSWAQTWHLKVRICGKRSALCEEFNGDSEDVWTRRCECLVRKVDNKENK